MKTDVKKHLVIKAITRSFFAALSGSCIFVLGEIVVYLIRNDPVVNNNIWLWPVVVFLLIGAIIVSTPISLAGGILLVFTLYNDSKNNEFSMRDAFLKGAGFGILVSVGLSIVLLITYFPRGDWHVLLFQVVLGTIILSLMAGWVAIQLRNDILKVI